MAMTAYLKVTGSKQGELKGDCEQSGREDLILVYAGDHAVEIPKDTHTGLPTGQRIHHPFSITKHKDKSSPLLFGACCSGEQCEVELMYFRINSEGSEENYYTIKLSNAIIVKMREYTPPTFLEENKPYRDMEDIEFTYEKIIWSEVVAGTEAEDDWKTPKS